MPTEAKRATVAELTEAFSASKGAIVSEYRGLTVSDLTKVRRELRDKGGIIHVPFGKASFEPALLLDNLAALVDAVNRARPSAAKGQYFKNLTVASTMGPGIRVEVPGLLARAAA